MVVDIGCTQRLVPLMTPMLGDRASESAPVTLQVKAALSPRTMVPGAAAKDAMIGGAIDGSVRHALRTSPVRTTGLLGRPGRTSSMRLKRGPCCSGTVSMSSATAVAWVWVPVSVACQRGWVLPLDHHVLLHAAPTVVAGFKAPLPQGASDGCRDRSLPLRHH